VHVYPTFGKLYGVGEKYSMTQAEFFMDGRFATGKYGTDVWIDHWTCQTCFSTCHGNNRDMGMGIDTCYECTEQPQVKRDICGNNGSH